MERNRSELLTSYRTSTCWLLVYAPESTHFASGYHTRRLGFFIRCRCSVRKSDTSAPCERWEGKDVRKNESNIYWHAVPRTHFLLLLGYVPREQYPESCLALDCIVGKCYRVLWILPDVVGIVHRSNILAPEAMHRRSITEQIWVGAPRQMHIAEVK